MQFVDLRKARLQSSDAPRARVARLIRICLVVASTYSVGCIDVSARLGPADAGADVTPESDAARGDGGLSPCMTCITSPNDPGPGCGSEWATCTTDPRCRIFIECVDELGCFKIADRAEFIVCLSPCAPRIGLEGATDPVLNIATPVTFCGRAATCAPICNGSEPQ